jgi:glycosyltransferase EpsF
MKKVAVFPGVFLTGGVEAIVLNILASSDSQDYKFDFFVPRPVDPKLDNRVFTYGSRIIEIPQIKEVGSIKYIIKLLRIIKNTDRYDIIHVHSIHSGVLSSIVGFLLKIPLRVYHVHNTDDPVLVNMRFKKTYRSIMKFMINTFNNRYVACGQDAANYIYYKRKIKLGKVIIFKNKIDLLKYSPQNKKSIAEKTALFSESGLIIGNAARFTVVKNQIFLITLLKEINKKKNCYLVLAGDGETLNECKEYSKEIGVYDKVKFLGNIDDMPGFYNIIDIFVLPSFHEGLPISILESQACGIPSLLSNSITKEVDLNLKLVKYLSLTETIDLWVETILEHVSNRIYDNQLIKEKFIENDYSLDDIKYQIKDIYSLKNNGRTTW